MIVRGATARPALLIAADAIRRYFAPLEWMGAKLARIPERIRWLRSSTRDSSTERLMVRVAESASPLGREYSEVLTDSLVMACRDASKAAYFTYRLEPRRSLAWTISRAMRGIPIFQREAGDPWRALLVGTTYSRLGRYGEARAELYRALREGRESGDRSLRVVTGLAIGQLHYSQGDYTRARRWLRGALPLLTPDDHLTRLLTGTDLLIISLHEGEEDEIVALRTRLAQWLDSAGAEPAGDPQAEVILDFCRHVQRDLDTVVEKGPRQDLARELVRMRELIW